MSKEQYIYMAEMSSDDDVLNITPKLASMNFFKKFISKLLTPLKEELKQSLEALEKRNALLEEQVLNMSNDLSIISKKMETLLADNNTKKASLDSKYKKAIDVFCELGKEIIDNVPRFGRAGKLNVIQMLVQYLYNPTDDLLDNIKSEATDGDKAISILKDIANFNNTLKPDLIHYLSSIEKKWEDCVLFPDECTYNPSTMQYFNNEIEEGTPIYVVSLGYDFPKSNLEKRLPKVFPKDIEKKN